MINVKISTTIQNFPLQRQTPGEKGEWGNCNFQINSSDTECDYWVVYDDLTAPEKIKCSKSNTLLITGEPPSIKTYNREYINQFGTILTCHRNFDHKDVINSQQALPWMIGGKFIKETKTWKKEFTNNFDELSQGEISEKDHFASIILSKKKATPGHRQRNAFLKYLKDELRSNLDIFGVGYNEIEDKWNGISPYKYYFAIENSRYPDYWTEKLSDCFLAGAYPFYHGCPNIFEYFPESCLTVIDINNPREAISIITSLVNQNTWEKNIDNIQYARNLVLNKYNLFPTIEKIINSRYQKKESEELLMLPNSNYDHYSFSAKIKKHVRAIYQNHFTI